MKIFYRMIGIASLSGALLLAACNDNGSSGSSPAATYGLSGGGTPLPGVPGYVVNYLVADKASVQTTYKATYVDPALVNPWGICIGGGPVWVANQGTSTTTLYDGTGVSQRAAIAIATGSKGAGPTGIVCVGGALGFVLPNGTKASFMYSTLAGTLVGWNSGTGGTSTVVYDGGASGASYTGLAMGADSSSNFYLYAANFSQAKVDMFDKAFNKVTPAGGFVDPAIPAGYAPYGIQNLPSNGGKTTQIYVTYAQQNAAKTAAVTGAGLGYVAVFDYTGKLISTLISGGALNAPWGMAIADPEFGQYGGNLLIGNFGDGKINVYNYATGDSYGTLKDTSGNPIAISGLWGLSFGNNSNAQPTSTLFFAAGVNNQADGVYGRIDYAIAGYGPASGF
jgi:uncharacterized protein (TIGR03118 family)